MQCIMQSLLFLFVSLFFLAACAPFHPDNTHAGMCNQLNSQIIFSGSTNITRNAEIQSAEEPLEQQSYDRNCVKGFPNS